MKPEQGQDSPPWLDIAEGQLGTREFAGKASNPEVTKYFAATTKGAATPDSVPWCSAFANWVMDQAGYHGTRLANARSWLDWGMIIEEPKVGCIAVLESMDRGPKAGHVGFFVAGLPHRVILLGGNQLDGVCRREFGIGRVLGYRWPKDSDRRHPLVVG